MSFLDGLYAYEVILLGLGVLLFLVLVVCLAARIFRGQSFAGLLLFFAVPIVMISYPGLQSVEIGSNGVKLTKELAALEKDPQNDSLRASVELTLADLSSRPISNPKLSVSMARAQIALGNDSAAEAQLDKTLQESPKSQGALELKNRINLDRSLADLTKRVEDNPTDTAAKTMLDSTAREVAQQPLASPKTMLNLARAKTALGNQEEAKAYLDTVLAIDSNLTTAADALKKRLFGTP